MLRPSITIEELLRLFPDADELDELRAEILAAGAPDPAKAWEKSAEYTTVDKRIVLEARALEAVGRAEESARQRLGELFATYREAIASYFQGNPAESAFALIRLAEGEEQRTRYGRAREYLNSALLISLPLPDKAPQIRALRLLGRVLRRQGDLHEAALCYHRSAEMASATGEVRSEVIATTGLGNVRLYQGKWAEAESLYHAAVNRLDESGAGHDLERGQLYNNLGTACTRLKRLEEAEEWFRKALALWERLDSVDDLAICHHNYGLLRVHQQRHGEARDSFKRALDLPVSSALRAAMATDLALAYLEDGQIGQAKEAGRIAEEHAIAAQSPHVLGSMYRGLGNIARADGDEGGITFFEKALEIARQKSDLVLEGETLIDYAQLRYHTGEAEEAISYLSRARDIFESLGDEAELERAQRLIADLGPPSAAVAD